MAVAYGLPVKDGLRAVTLSAAEILKVEKDLGSLTKGKTANIIISDGHPLQHTTQIKGVFVAGKPFAPTSRQTRLYEKYRKRLHEYRAKNGEVSNSTGGK
jgi:imidazolonepropionase-like amidohydrolase